MWAGGSESLSRESADQRLAWRWAHGASWGLRDIAAGDGNRSRDAGGERELLSIRVWAARGRLRGEAAACVERLRVEIAALERHPPAVATLVRWYPSGCFQSARRWHRLGGGAGGGIGSGRRRTSVLDRAWSDDGRR
jgi:hypothetical protein